MAVKFEWDESKARTNGIKHGVTFDEAISVFRDLFSITMTDPDHSTAEENRWITLGRSIENRLLVVVHHDRDDDHIRIISARRATATERRRYAERL